ncbi:MAG: hypothetical protein ABI689_18290 [Thermoanaerobaculia bacterium]
MRPEIAAADRQFVVRRAATAWRKAGEIDGGAEAAIATLYPDDRVRTSKVFRILFFIFTGFGFSTAYGFGLAFLAAAGMRWDEGGGFALVNMAAGAAMLGAAEWLTGGMRLRRFGIEEACVWIGWGYLVGGGLWWMESVLDAGFALLLVAGAWATAGVATLIVWRWATPGMGAVAALALFVGLSQAPWNHLLWLLVAGLLAWPLGTLAIAPHVSPEHRKRFGEAFVVFVLMFYVAVHVTVVESRFFPFARALDSWFSNGGSRPDPVPAWVVAASLAAMIAVPAVLLGLGLARRYRAAIVMGLLLAAATGITFAQRWGTWPLWLRLLLEGAALGALALYLRRALERRDGAEWRGLTALALAENRESLQTLEVVATLAVFTPAARQAEVGGFEGGGGDFGGGGASAKF